jgi:hypothetical protein
MELTDECAICSEEYSEINAKITLKCKHEFCESCITKWINKSNTCPTCRRSITLSDLEDAINRSESKLYLEERKFMTEGVSPWKLIDLISPFNEVYKKQQELLKKHSESLEKLYLIDTYIKTKRTKYNLQSLLDAVENEKEARDQVKYNLSYLPFLPEANNNIFTQRLYSLYSHIINAQTLATQACIMFIVTSITYYIHAENNSTEPILFKYWFDVEGNNGLNEKDNLEKIKSTLNEAIESVLLAKDHANIVNRILNKIMWWMRTPETHTLIGIIDKIENAEVISQMNISDALFSLKEFIVMPQMESYEHYSLQMYTKRFEQIEAIEALITTIEDQTKAQITTINESVKRDRMSKKKFTVSWLQNKNKTQIAELTKLQKKLIKQKEELSIEKRLRSNWDGKSQFDRLEEKVTKRDALQAPQAQQALVDAYASDMAAQGPEVEAPLVGGLRTTKRRRTKQLTTKRRRTKQVATKRQRTKQLATKRQRITKKK